MQHHRCTPADCKNEQCCPHHASTSSCAASWSRASAARRRSAGPPRRAGGAPSAASRRGTVRHRRRAVAARCGDLALDEKREKARVVARRPRGRRGGRDAGNLEAAPARRGASIASGVGGLGDIVARRTASPKAEALAVLRAARALQRRPAPCPSNILRGPRADVGRAPPGPGPWATRSASSSAGTATSPSAAAPRRPRRRGRAAGLRAHGRALARRRRAAPTPRGAASCSARAPPCSCSRTRRVRRAGAPRRAARLRPAATPSWRRRDGTGVLRAARTALGDAGLDAHPWTRERARAGTPAGDAASSRRRALLEGRGDDALVASTKGATGRLLGAAGASGLLRVSRPHGLAPATAHLAAPLPTSARVTLVAEATRRDLRVALSTSSGRRDERGLVLPALIVATSASRRV